MSDTVVDWNAAGKILSLEQKQFYNKNGYLLMRNCVAKSEIDRFHRRFQEICRGVNVSSEMTVALDPLAVQNGQSKGESAVSKLRDTTHDPVLFEYCRCPAIVDVVSDLIAKPNDCIMAMHGMLINKPPHSSFHPTHQDLAYFNFRPADLICAAWTAMEKVTRANGCLFVVPGSHKWKNEVLDHGYPKWDKDVNRAYYGVKEFNPNTAELIHVEMEAGDTLFFHSLLLHGSGANRTNGFRKAISCHYANGDRCRYISVTGTNQEIIEKMTVETMQKRLKKLGRENEIATFADYFRRQAKPVGNRRANL
ncbi:hypothetical protein M3Y98_00233900 [Aphelenchoides besseyi]|nr:hypothetical protein M3Y98_00233900 [Aphelenchoides besseyi]KAI6200614.1 hypothetical protein M3Y96_00752600 [Aphelenchoides besseyi]